MKGETLKALLIEKGLSPIEADEALDQARKDFAKEKKEPKDYGLSPMVIYEITGCECAQVDPKVPWARTKTGEISNHIGLRVVCLKITPWGIDRVREGESHRALFLMEVGGRIVSLRIRAFAKAHTFKEIGSLAEHFPS